MQNTHTHTSYTLTCVAHKHVLLLSSLVALCDVGGLRHGGGGRGRRGSVGFVLLVIRAVDLALYIQCVTTVCRCVMHKLGKAPYLDSNVEQRVDKLRLHLVRL